MFLHSSILFNSRPIHDTDGCTLPLVAAIDVPLPGNGRDWFMSESFDLAWPQVLAFVAAIGGILSVMLILRTFTGRS